MTVESEEVLFSENAIARRVQELADRIAEARLKPEIVVPILLGGFVFAADLLRALANRKLMLPIEFIRLASYDDRGVPGKIEILNGPSEEIKGKHVLLVDGVLESGGTLAKAKEVLRDAGVRSIVIAVLVAKKHAGRLSEADHVGFEAGPEFLYGYGMDRAGFGRGLPDIRVARASG